MRRERRTRQDYHAVLSSRPGFEKGLDVRRVLPAILLFALGCGSGGTADPMALPDVKYVKPDPGKDPSPEESSAPEPVPEPLPEPVPEPLPDPVPEPQPETDTVPELPPDPTPDVPDVPGCAPEGAPCDDGDPCTANDACAGGVCSGKPYPCPDDGLPCTDERCEAGKCERPLRAGFCLIDGFCWPDGQPDPNAECSACDPGRDPDGWSEVAGCKPEGCEFHADCHPGGWCAPHFAEGKDKCSTPCASAGDCADGDVCTPLPGSANQGYCQPIPNPPGLENGANCANGWSCKGGLCLDSRCTTSCPDGQACGAGTTCQAVGSLAAGVNGACAPDLPGMLPAGTECLTQDGKAWDGATCRSGHCDLLAAKPPCAPLCSTDAQCAASQECNLVIRTSAAIPEALPYHPQFTADTYDAILGCYSRPGSGMLAVGATCKGPGECRTNKCMALLPNDPTMRCTTFCARDADCPAPMTCVAEAITLTSWWLQQAGQADPDPSHRTLVRVCR